MIVAAAGDESVHFAHLARDPPSFPENEQQEPGGIAQNAHHFCIWRAEKGSGLFLPVEFA
jgi:hypothetical protein